MLILIANLGNLYESVVGILSMVFQEVLKVFFLRKPFELSRLPEPLVDEAFVIDLLEHPPDRLHVPFNRMI